MDTPILHHYWGSPYAEKIRLLFGYKRIAWRSAEIPVVPPRPSLAPILGAFRRTPVLQLGADYVCDTRLIVELIDRLVPSPSFGAENQALSAFLSGWVEPRVFALLGPFRFRSAADVAGTAEGRVSAEGFAKDRLPFMHPVYDAERYPKLAASSRDHLRRFMDVVERFFADGPSFIGGERPTHGDFSAYHTTWWLRRPPAHAEFLAHYPLIGQWADRMAAFGHGSFTTITGDDARRIAAAAAPSGHPWGPEPSEEIDERLGRHVTIVPDDYGRNAIEGEVVATSDRHLTIERTAFGIGAVRVHFPRLGYEITDA